MRGLPHNTVSTTRRAAHVLACFVVCLSVTTLCAQEAEPAAGAPAAESPAAPAAPEAPAPDPEDQPRTSIWSMLPLWIGIMALYYLMVSRPGSNQRARTESLTNLKQNDRVVTTGGIVGTVANVHETTGEVTIRSGDTPLRIQRDAIREVVTETKSND